MENRQFLTMSCDVAKAKVGSDDNDRVLRFIGSTATRDRMGDEIQLSGWQTKSYMKNPVFLWAHNYQEPPIGKAIKVEKTDNGLMFDIEFAPAEIYPKAEQIFQLYKHGFLKATSVGFKSLNSEWIKEDTEEEAKKKKKDPDSKPGLMYKKQELLELSGVPVPANPEALMTAKKKGFDVPEDVQRYVDNKAELRNWAESKDNYALQELSETIKELQKDIKELRLSKSESDEETNKPKPDAKPKPTAQPDDENVNTGEESEEISEGDESTAQPESENANTDGKSEDDDDEFIEIVDDDDDVDDDVDDDDVDNDDNE